MPAPPWLELAITLCKNRDTVMDESCKPVVVQALAELQGHAQLYVPPYGGILLRSTQLLEGLPGVLCAASRVMLSQHSEVLAHHWQYVVQMLQTTALYTYQAYARDGDSLDHIIALDLATQVVQSGLLKGAALPMAMVAAATQLFNAALQQAGSMTSVTNAASCATMHYGFAMLQLFGSLNRMWPSGILKSKDAAGAAAAAPALAVALLKAASQQPGQLRANFRLDHILNEALGIVLGFIPQLHSVITASPARQKGIAAVQLSTDFDDLAASAPFLLLVLLLFEVQFQQLSDQMQSAAFSGAVNTAASSAEEAALPANSTLQKQKQQYHDNLLKQLGQPSLQQWDTLCSTANSSSSSSSDVDAAAACITTLRVVASLLLTWKMVRLDQYLQDIHNTNREILSSNEIQLLQSVLPQLPARLLHLATSNTTATTANIPASRASIHRSALCSAAIAAAREAADFVCTMFQDGSSLLPVSEILSLATQYIASVAKYRCERASEADSSGWNKDLVLLQFLLARMTGSEQFSGSDAVAWGRHGQELSSGIESCWRLSAAAAVKAAALEHDASTYVDSISSIGSLVRPRQVKQSPLMLVSGDVGIRRDHLFALLVSTCKIAERLSFHYQSYQYYETMARSFAFGAQLVCCKHLSAEGSDSKTSSSRFSNSEACLLAVPWLLLMARCIGYRMMLVQPANIKMLARIEHAQAVLNLQQMYAKELSRNIGALLEQLVKLAAKSQDNSSSSSSSSIRSRYLGRWHNTPVAQSAAAAAAYWAGLQPCINQLQRAKEKAEILSVSVDSANKQLAMSKDNEAADMARSPHGVHVQSTQLLENVQQLLTAMALQQDIDDFAAALTAALPVPHCCNNLYCKNLATASELQLVGASSCMCAECKMARYCSRACQKAAWRLHKPVCQRLKAAAAAAAEQAASPDSAV